MQKPTFTLLILCFSVLYTVAQDDYVISKPEAKKDLKKQGFIDTLNIANPDYTAYFLNATAFTLKKKQIRLSGTNVLFMKGSYGITNSTSVSANLSFFANYGPLTVSLKQKIVLNEVITVGVSISGGSMLLIFSDPNINSDRDSNIYFGGGQTMVTLGDKQDNITVGTGLYYLKGTFDFSGNRKNDFMVNTAYIGFQKQIIKKLYIVGEGMYFLNAQVFTGGIGVKLVVGDRVALNIGLMPLGFNDPSSRSTEVPLAIPLISFRMLLGRK